MVSSDTDQVLRFDGATGDFLGLFATIPDPLAIAADGAGLVYVVQRDGVVRQYDETGDLIDFAISGFGASAPPRSAPTTARRGLDFVTDFVIVPEPGAAGSAAVVALALLGLGARRR